MLKKYLEDNGIRKDWFAKKIGISEQSLFAIINNKSKYTKAITCNKIEKETGLKSWMYLDGLEALEKIDK